MLSFLHLWGSVIGLTADFAGALLVYKGVSTSFKEAWELEKPVVPMTISSIGAPETLHAATTISGQRAHERVRAARWAFYGVILFLFGAILQMFGSWPKG